MVPHVRAELEVLRAAPVAVDAGEDGGVGEGLEGEVTDGLRVGPVGGGAAVADAFAVRFHVDGGAGEVALAKAAFQVLEDVVGDVFAADLCEGIKNVKTKGMCLHAAKYNFNSLLFVASKTITSVLIDFGN